MAQELDYKVGCENSVLYQWDPGFFEALAITTEPTVHRDYVLLT